MESERQGYYPNGEYCIDKLMMQLILGMIPSPKWSMLVNRERKTACESFDSQAVLL